MSESGSEMSYADVVASGPQQSAEEARANPVDEVIPTDQSVESLIDVNTGVAVVPNDFLEQEVQTETQAKRIELEEAAAAEAAEAAEAEKKAEKREARKEKASDKASDKAAKKEKAKTLAQNPIIQANGVLFAIAAIALGFGAYRKHQAGQLTWKLAGLWSVGVATLVGGDYCLSNFLWKKYPFSKK